MSDSLIDPDSNLESGNAPETVPAVTGFPLAQERGELCKGAQEVLNKRSGPTVLNEPDSAGGEDKAISEALLGVVIGWGLD